MRFHKNRLLFASTICLGVALVSFAFGLVWLGRAKEDAAVLATLYRDLPKLHRDSDRAQRDADLGSIQTLSSKRVPYQWPFVIGLVSGGAAFVALLMSARRR